MAFNVKVKLKIYGPAVLSGILLFLSFPNFDLYPLAWISLVPLLVSLWEKDGLTAFKAGYLSGTIYFSGTLYWIYHSITYYGNVPFFLSIIVVLLLSLYLGLYVGLFGMAFSIKILRSRLPAVIMAPIFWVTLEFIRSYALTGFPWASLGYSQYKFLTLIQIADITGIYGVSFLIVAFNAAIVDLFLIRKKEERMPLLSRFWIYAGIIGLSILLILTVVYGQLRLNQIRPGKMVRVALIQGNIEQDKKWLPEYQSSVLSTYESLTLQAMSYSPSMIIWPETALPFYFGYEKGPTENFKAFQKGLGTYLLTGGIIVKKPPLKGIKGELTNSAILLDRGGNIPYIYDKIHLVPFGEYVPLKRVLFFLDKLVVGIGDYTPGDKILKANTDLGSFGTFVCYEIIFPGLVRKFYSKGGDFIVTITNDAWFGKTAGPYQHFSMAVFRAIENRKPVLRAANTGISGYIDSNGRIIKATPIFERRFDIIDMRTDSTGTIYSRYGDIFAYLCIIGMILLVI
ncbi:MAG: apolipoprotein N-acyltransferase [Thermodesulfovibrionales bacterium]